MSAPAIRSGIDQKLHRLARPVYSGVSAPAERPRDVEAKAGGQKLAEAEAGGQRPADVEAGDPKLVDSEVGGLRSESQ